MLVGFVNAAVLPVGRDTNDHVYVSGSPSGSHERLPSRRAVWRRAIVWSEPARATGAELLVEIITASGVLSPWPSLTMSCTMYVPG